MLNSRVTVSTGVMKLIPLPTHRMVADALTKSLPGPSLPPFPQYTLPVLVSFLFLPLLAATLDVWRVHFMRRLYRMSMSPCMPCVSYADPYDNDLCAAVTPRPAWNLRSGCLGDILTKPLPGFPQVWHRPGRERWFCRKKWARHPSA